MKEMQRTDAMKLISFVALVTVQPAACDARII